MGGTVDSIGLPRKLPLRGKHQTTSLITVIHSAYTWSQPLNLSSLLAQFKFSLAPMQVGGGAVTHRRAIWSGLAVQLQVLAPHFPLGILWVPGRLHCRSNGWIPRSKPSPAHSAPAGGLGVCGRFSGRFQDAGHSSSDLGSTLSGGAPATQISLLALNSVPQFLTSATHLQDQRPATQPDQVS
jgi:hypothetical protein